MSAADHLHRESILELWRDKLLSIQSLYQRVRPKTKYFYLKLFLFFIIVNVSCYWLAMLTAFPHYVFNRAVIHYAKIMVPVGLLGALFDSLSFFITLFLIKRAIAARSAIRFTAHLSIDFIIAIIATWWVLFVFVLSGWLINMMDGKTYQKNEQGQFVVVKTKDLGDKLSQDDIKKQHFEQRKNIYTQRLVDAIENPSKNIRNIYFGIIMGMSAMLPTCLHISMFLYALYTRLKFRLIS